MNICCPLCGRHVPEDVFDPTGFGQDIYGVEVTGLGRGRGFAVTNKFSILDDPLITGLIADRCHRILDMIDRGTYLPRQEYDALRATLESWIRHARKLENENNELKDELEEMEDLDDDENQGDYTSRLLQKINQETNFDFEDLEEAIEFLLEN